MRQEMKVADVDIQFLAPVIIFPLNRIEHLKVDSTSALVIQLGKPLHRVAPSLSSDVAIYR